MNVNYRWSLDPTSRKEICPRCGRKTFVIYVDSDGQSLSLEVGKCDRKDKCNWHYTPREFMQDRGLGISRHDVRMQIRPKFKPIEPDYIDHELFAKCLCRGQNHSLGVFLHSIFDSLIGVNEVERCMIKMGIGKSDLFGGSPVFWQIDVANHIRTGKIMGYNPTTGKRIKEPRPQLKWVHKLVQNSKPDYRLRQCYFASHTVTDAGEDVKPIIALFESEKAATIMALTLMAVGAEGLMYPMATGGCEAFNPSQEKMSDNYDALEVLRGRRVVLYPDQGKFEDWASKGLRLRGYASEVYISTVMESGLHPFQLDCEVECGDGFDDVLLQYIKKGKNPDELADLLAYSYGYKGRGRLA